MHRNLGLDWAQDALHVATLQSGFRGFSVQEVRSAPLPAEGSQRRSPRWGSRLRPVATTRWPWRCPARSRPPT
jgi:hypothetical protein